MSDSARNRANGFETLNGGKSSGPYVKNGGSGGSTGGLKYLAIILVCIGLIIVAFNSAYKIGEQEQGVLVTFGKAQAVTDPGLHFKIPFVQQIRR